MCGTGRSEHAWHHHPHSHHVSRSISECFLFLAGTAAIAHTDERVEALASFQEAALRHALRFPAALRVAYSTCSLHEREDEAVVAAVLQEAGELGFGLVAALPAWPRRGVEGALPAEEAAKVVRTGESCNFGSCAGHDAP